MHEYDEIVRKAGMEHSAYVGDLIARGVMAFVRLFRRRKDREQVNVWKRT